MKECVVRSVHKSHGDSPDWKEFARLKSVFLLKMTGTVEHVLELSIGAVRIQSVAIKFRGRRGQRLAAVASGAWPGRLDAEASRRVRHPGGSRSLGLTPIAACAQ